MEITQPPPPQVAAVDDSDKPAAPVETSVAVAALEQQRGVASEDPPGRVSTPPLKPKADELRELSLSAVTPLLERVPCAALNATLSNGKLTVEGYVSSQFDVKGLRREL